MRIVLTPPVPEAPPYDPAKIGILSQIVGKAVENAKQGAHESAREMTYEIITGIFEGLRDLILDFSFSFTLLGVGISLILHVAGWNKGIQRAGTLTVGYVIVKFLLLR